MTSSSLTGGGEVLAPEGRGCRVLERERDHDRLTLGAGVAFEDDVLVHDDGLGVGARHDPDGVAVLRHGHGLGDRLDGAVSGLVDDDDAVGREQPAARDAGTGNEDGEEEGRGHDGSDTGGR